MMDDGGWRMDDGGWMMDEGRGKREDGRGLRGDATDGGGGYDDILKSFLKLVQNYEINRNKHLQFSFFCYLCTVILDNNGRIAVLL